VGFEKTYRKARFPRLGRVLLALFGCSTLCSAHLLGGLLGSAARKAVTSTGLFGSAARSATLATPPCIRFGIRHQNRAERGTLGKTAKTKTDGCMMLEVVVLSFHQAAEIG